MDTDASNKSIGGVLSQIQNGEEKVIAYASRRLTPTQKKYCVTRRELLAVVAFCHHFKHYLLGRKFLLRTDHSSLPWLFRFKSPQGQLARWLEEVSQYSFKVEHRAGKSHVNADAMSRIPDEEDCPCYLAGAKLETLPCGGCVYCSKLHDSWERFQEDVDDVVPLAVRAATVNDPGNANHEPADNQPQCNWAQTKSPIELHNEQMKDEDLEELYNIVQK